MAERDATDEIAVYLARMRLEQKTASFAEEMRILRYSGSQACTAIERFAQAVARHTAEEGE